MGSCSSRTNLQPSLCTGRALSSLTQHQGPGSSQRPAHGPAHSPGLGSCMCPCAQRPRLLATGGGAKPRARRLVSAVSGSAVTYSWCPPLLVTQDRGTGQGRWLEAWVPAGWIECSGNMGSHNMGSGLQWRGGSLGQRACHLGDTGKAG